MPLRDSVSRYDKQRRLKRHVLILVTQLSDPLIAPCALHPDLQGDKDLLQPRLAAGETAQGVLVAAYLPAEEKLGTTTETYSNFRLRDLLYG